MVTDTAVAAEMLDILADIQCALVMTRNHTPELTVGSFVDSSTQFKRLDDFLHAMAETPAPLSHTGVNHG